MVKSFVIGFVIMTLFFLAANVVAVHSLSDAGLLAGLGITDNTADDIRRFGWPLLFFEEGGFEYRRLFDARALLTDIGIGVGAALLAGVGCAVASLLEAKAENDASPP